MVLYPMVIFALALLIGMGWSVYKWSAKIREIKKIDRYWGEEIGIITNELNRRVNKERGENAKCK